VVRLRHSKLFPLVLPFVVAALVNSAGGWESYKYAVLAVALALPANDAAGQRLLRQRAIGPGRFAHPGVREREQAEPAGAEVPS
jgi:hypothetical protein